MTQECVGSIDWDGGWRVIDTLETLELLIELRGLARQRHAT